MEKAMIAGVAVASAIYAIDKAYSYIVPKEYGSAPREGQRVIVPFGRGNKKCEGFIIKLEYAEAKKGTKYLSHIFDDEVYLSREDIALALWVSQRYFCTFFEAANALLPPGVWDKRNEVYHPGDMSLEEALTMFEKSKKKQEILRAVFLSEHGLTIEKIAELTNIKAPEAHLRALTAAATIVVRQRIQKKIGDKSIWMISMAMDYDQAILQIGKGKIAQRRKQLIDIVSRADDIPEKELIYQSGASVDMIKRLSKIGVFSRESRGVFRRPGIKSKGQREEITLSDSQQSAYEGISGLMAGNEASVALLYGVTGSGKTLIYMKLLEKALETGKTAIMLVPEIVLTPQMVRRLYDYFGDKIAIVHSNLTTAQRYDEYKRIKQKKAEIVVGTRTGVFAPLDNIGIIIMDEEQEYTYKSENPPRYHAREVAKYRAVKHNALLLLGSATPSIESFYYAECNRYKLFNLPGRYNAAALPDVKIANIREELLNEEEHQLGRDLFNEININLEKKEQTVLFFNRRGSAKMAMCAICGYTVKCENCSVALTYHSKNGRTMCHHCGYSQTLVTTCPECGGEHIRLVGSGTQKVEEELLQRIPGIRVLRMDADTVSGRATHEELLDGFEKGSYDILVGTQMVSKGLDFENVTLVGVIDADLSLYSGDYHAQERTFSLLSQVVGRAGRRKKPGRAILQTYTPDNPVIKAAARQDYDEFFRLEKQTRRALMAPPFSDMFVFTVSGIDEKNALGGALAVSAIIARGFNEEFTDIKTPILGPVPAAIARLNKRYRFIVSFRGVESRRSRSLVSRVLINYLKSPYAKLTSISADINPY